MQGRGRRPGGALEPRRSTASHARRHSPFKPLNAQGSIGQTTVKHTPGGPVYTVPGNNNLYWSGRPGTRYNMGSGLGIPNLTELGRAFSR